jgi:hypothetical protein
MKREYGSYGDENPSSNVKYNAGYFHTQRIHEIQSMINICKINPTTYNQDYNSWNYEIWLNCLNALLDEIWSNLDDDDDDEKSEIKQANKVRKGVLGPIRKLSIVQPKNVDSFSNKKVLVINNEEWYKIYDLLMMYDNYIKILMKKHGWNNPEGDYEREDDI